jgi:TatD DNase family protein
MLIDAHCHIHEVDYPLNADESLQRAHENGVDKVICVGTSLNSSRQAVAFANNHDEVYAAIGIHPHETKDGFKGLEDIVSEVDLSRLRKHLQPEFDQTPGLLSNPERSRFRAEMNQPAALGKLVAIGEIGLDYFYDNSPREVQKEALKWQIQLALDNNLPIIFHVRDAFDDFWPIFDSFKGIRGEIHSFTDNKANLDEALKRGLYVGVNGISTFTRDESQKAVFNSIPLDRLLIETDAPFLTPVPFRGKVNEPAFVKNIAEFHAVARGISIEQIAVATTANARALFAL